MSYKDAPLSGGGRVMRLGRPPESRRNPGEFWGGKPALRLIPRAGNEREPRDKPAQPDIAAK